MKSLIFSLFFILIFSGCQKSHGCTDVTVTLTAPSCKHIGVIINSKIYPTDDLPDAYAVEGKHICIEYTLYEDLRLCACCGGTVAHIIKVY